MNDKLSKINIQLFAQGEDKTEKATPKRKEDARKEGQVLQSREIKTALLLIITFFILKLTGSYMYKNITDFMKKIFTYYINKEDLMQKPNFIILISETMFLGLKIMAPIAGAALIGGLVASYAQIGFLFTTKTLKPKLSRINPLEGFKRLFSANAGMELIKSIAKIILVAYLAYKYIKEEINSVINLIDMEVSQVGLYIWEISINIALKIGLILIFLGLVDYIFQWRQYEKNLRMSKHEIKEEYKQMEGNMQIKSKIKQKQREMSLRRMMTDVPKADVIITNPTHLAIAIKYDAELTDAPIVLAKGQNYIAERIKEIAKENKIELVENKPLARSLYETTDIGQEIPAELFQAVAEVLAFVYSL